MYESVENIPESFKQIPIHIREIDITYHKMVSGFAIGEHLATFKSPMYVYQSDDTVLYEMSPSISPEPVVDGVTIYVSSNEVYPSRDTCLKRWNAVRESDPNFSYTVTDTKTNLYDMIKGHVSNYDRYADYIDGPQWSEVENSNDKIESFVNKMTSTFAPETNLYNPLNPHLNTFKYLTRSIQLFKKMDVTPVFKKVEPKSWNYIDGDPRSWYGISFNSKEIPSSYKLGYVLEYLKEHTLPMIKETLTFLKKEKYRNHQGKLHMGEDIIPGTKNFYETYEVFRDFYQMVDNLYHQAEKEEIFYLHAPASEDASDKEALIQKYKDKAQVFQQTAQEAIIDFASRHLNLPIVKEVVEEYIDRDSLPKEKTSRSFGCVSEEDLSALSKQKGSVIAETAPRDASVGSNKYFAGSSEDFMKFIHFDSMDGTEVMPASQVDTVQSLVIDGKAKNIQDLNLNLTEVGGLFILPNVPREEKKEYHLIDGVAVFPLKEEPNIYESCQKDFLQDMVMRKYEGREDIFMNQNAQKEFVNLSNLHEYVQAYIDIVTSKPIYRDLDVSKNDTFQEKIDPLIAEHLMKKAQKDYPDARTSQINRYVGNVLTAGSPLSFSKGKNYGINLAESTQQKLAQTKKEELQQ